jgi:hypothetical protein
MVGFVDDSNGQTKHLFRRKQNTHDNRYFINYQGSNAQIWSNLLNTTGGALELTKCSYHVMAWQFKGAGSPVLTIDSEKYSGAHVIVDSTTGDGKRLKYLSPCEAHKALLGHYKEPAGTQKEQYRQQKRKSNGSVEFMRNCTLTREEAWTYHYMHATCQALVIRKQIHTLRKHN